MENTCDTYYSNLLSNGTTTGALRFVPRHNDRYFGIKARKLLTA